MQKHYFLEFPQDCTQLTQHVVSLTHSLSEQNAFNEKLGIDKQAPARQTVECSHLKVNSFYDSHEAVVTAVIFTISQNIQCRIIKTNITVIHNAIKE